MRLVLAGAVLLLVATGCPQDAAVSPTPPAGTPTPLTGTPHPAPPTDVEPFVDAFMDARLEGDVARAEAFLSPQAKEQFDAAEDGLELADPAYRSWERLSLEAIDASSFEVQVRIHTEADGSFVEFLFVGWGVDLEGDERELVVRGAMRREPA